MIKKEVIVIQVSWYLHSTSFLKLSSPNVPAWLHAHNLTVIQEFNI